MKNFEIILKLTDLLFETLTICEIVKGHCKPPSKAFIMAGITRVYQTNNEKIEIELEKLIKEIVEISAFDKQIEHFLLTEYQDLKSFKELALYWIQEIKSQTNL